MNNQTVYIESRAILEHLRNELAEVDEYLKNVKWTGAIDLVIHDGGNVSVSKRGKTPGAVVSK